MGAAGAAGIATSAGSGGTSSSAGSAADSGGTTGGSDHDNPADSETSGCACRTPGSARGEAATPALLAVLAVAFGAVRRRSMGLRWRQGRMGRSAHSPRWGEDGILSE